MPRIDSYTHFGPLKFLASAEKLEGQAFHMGDMFKSIAALNDPVARLDLLDRHEVDTHIMVATPGIEAFPRIAADRVLAADVARIMNDELAEVVAAYPRRFRAVGMIPTCDVESMVAEVRRAVGKLGFPGVIVHVGPTLKPMDHPDYEPLYQALSDLDATLWLHPSRPPTLPEYEGETASRFMEWLAIGWLHDTTSAMFRIVFSGVFERHPRLRIVTHHHGALVPYHADRFDLVWTLFEKGVPTPISKPYLDHFRNFYVDTAVLGFAPKVLELAVDFFGADHVLFGSDSPLDGKGGEFFSSQTIRSIEEMAVPDEARRAIFGGNAARILKLVTP